jgi:hypothetical protein
MRLALKSFTAKTNEYWKQYFKLSRRMEVIKSFRATSHVNSVNFLTTEEKKGL